MNVFLKELKVNIQQGWNVHPLLVVIDGVNTLFQERTFINKKLSKRKNHAPITPKFLRESCTPDELSLLVSLKHLLKADYKNSAILASVDRTLNMNLDKKNLRGHMRHAWIRKARDMRPDTESDLPFQLLGNHGWNFMHPFIPIQTEKYTPGELDVIIDYHVDKRYKNLLLLCHYSIFDSFFSYCRKYAATDMGRKEINFLTARNPGEFRKLSNFF